MADRPAPSRTTRPAPRNRRRALTALRAAHAAAPRTAAAALLACAACNGNARLEIISLQPAAIDPPPPVTYRYDADQAYWWLDPSGDLLVALRFRKHELFSPIGPAELRLSFAFDGPPAGSGRTYAIGRREVRGHFSAGMEQHRFLSHQGICAVTRKPNDTLVGSFRVWLTHQPGPGLFDLFPRQPGPVLFQGTFDAVPDRNGAGRQILADTEAAGWSREPKPAATPR